MSTGVMSATVVDTDEQVDKRLELARRFALAGIADPVVFEGIPRDVVLFLLPDDDPSFVERELAAGLASARQGQDVYFRHVRAIDLPM